jgi:diacylglycerol O-acyltransferase / wax synthase
VMSRHLDRSRPLWEMYLIEGLEADKVGYLLKLHHAIADGLGGIAVARTILDTEAGVGAATLGTWTPAPSPGKVALFFRTFGLQVAGPFRLVWGAIRQTVSAPRISLQRAGGTAVGLWQLARAGTAPRSPLNRPVRPSRRFATVPLDLAQVKRVAAAFGATPNEVVLASMAGALRRFFQDRGDPIPARPLRAMVPVSVRPQGQRGVGGSWTTAYSFDLSLEPEAASPRMRAIVAAKKARERWRELGAARFVMNVMGTWLPRPLHRVASRLMYRDTWFNLIVSTMPGTSQGRYLAGARMEIAYPLLPLAEGVGLTVGTMTWEGRLAFGLTADAEILPDIDGLASALQASFDELVGAAAAEEAGVSYTPAARTPSDPSI